MEEGFKIFREVTSYSQRGTKSVCVWEGGRVLVNAMSKLTLQEEGREAGSPQQRSDSRAIFCPLHP